MSKITFVYQAPDDDSVDGEHELHIDGKFARIAIQDCRSYGGGYSVNKYGPDDDFWVMTLHECKTLKSAKQCALIALATQL